MGRFVDDGKGTRPGEIEADPVVVADHVEALEGIEDLDPVRAHLLDDAVVAQRVGHPDRQLAIAASDRGVGVDDPQVRIDTESGDEEDLARPVVGVKIAAVIGVAVARRHVPHGQRNLVHRVLVERDGHRFSLRAQVGVDRSEGRTRWPPASPKRSATAGRWS